MLPCGFDACPRQFLCSQQYKPQSIEKTGAQEQVNPNDVYFLNHSFWTHLRHTNHLQRQSTGMHVSCKLNTVVLGNIHEKFRFKAKFPLKKIRYNFRRRVQVKI